MAVAWHSPFYERLARAAGNKKFVSATAVADHGDSQALRVAPTRRALKWFVIGQAYLVNRSGSAATVGVGVRLPLTVWQAGQVTAAGAYTDATAAAQDAATDDFTLHNRSDSGAGVLIASEVPFNVVSLIVGVAGDQTIDARTIALWDGTSWVDIEASLLVGETLINDGTGEKLIWWPIPTWWVRGGDGTGVPQTTYNAKITHTTTGAGTADPAASQVFVGVGELMGIAVPDGGSVVWSGGGPVMMARKGDALFPIFSVAGADNYFAVDQGWW